MMLQSNFKKKKILEIFFSNFVAFSQYLNFKQIKHEFAYKQQENDAWKAIFLFHFPLHVAGLSASFHTNQALKIEKLSSWIL